MVRLISLIMIIIFSGTNTHAKELDLGSKMPLVKTKMLDISGKSISLSEAKGELPSSDTGTTNTGNSLWGITPPSY